MQRWGTPSEALTDCQSRFFCNERSLDCRNLENPVSLVGAGGLGVSLVLIHIYVAPLKRFLQALWALGVAGGLYLMLTQVPSLGKMMYALRIFFPVHVTLFSSFRFFSLPCWLGSVSDSGGRVPCVGFGSFTCCSFTPFQSHRAMSPFLPNECPFNSFKRFP